MIRSHLTAWIFIVALTNGMPLAPASGQETTELDRKQQEAIQKIQRHLDEELVETKLFKEEMTLLKFLQELEKQLPKAKQFALRIDREAFGDKFKGIAAT